MKYKLYGFAVGFILTSIILASVASFRQSKIFLGIVFLIIGLLLLLAHPIIKGIIMYLNIIRSTVRYANKHPKQTRKPKPAKKAPQKKRTPDMLEQFKKLSTELKYCIFAPIILAALYLISIANLEYGYYTFVRIMSLVALGIFIFMYCTELGSYLNFPSIAATVILILFNPIAPIELSKTPWIVLDILSAATMLAVTIYIICLHCYKPAKELEEQEYRERREREEHERQEQIRRNEEARRELFESWKHPELFPQDPGPTPLSRHYYDTYVQKEKGIKFDPKFPEPYELTEKDTPHYMMLAATTSTELELVEIRNECIARTKPHEYEIEVLEYWLKGCIRHYPHWSAPVIPAEERDFLLERYEVLYEYNAFFEKMLSTAASQPEYKNLYSRARSLYRSAWIANQKNDYIDVDFNKYR